MRPFNDDTLLISSLKSNTPPSIRFGATKEFWRLHKKNYSYIIDCSVSSIQWYIRRSQRVLGLFGCVSTDITKIRGGGGGGARNGFWEFEQVPGYRQSRRGRGTRWRRWPSRACGCRPCRWPDAARAAPRRGPCPGAPGSTAPWPPTEPARGGVGAWHAKVSVAESYGRASVWRGKTRLEGSKWW